MKNRVVETRRIRDAAARKALISYIENQKIRGKTTISIIDLHFKLKLPFQQIN
jgi:hypothetical protein